VYAAEHGLIPAFAASANPMAQARVRARVFEAVVLRHLESFLSGLHEVRFFRRSDGVEIDFIVEHGGETWAIEVTSSASVETRKVQRLYEAGTAVGAKHLVLIHGGTQEITDDRGRAVPLEKFLLDPRVIGSGSTS
jgi:predicted AAA+ superfamily ATPase